MFGYEIRVNKNVKEWYFLKVSVDKTDVNKIERVLEQ